MAAEAEISELSSCTKLIINYESDQMATDEKQTAGGENGRSSLFTSTEDVNENQNNVVLMNTTAPLQQPDLGSFEIEASKAAESNANMQINDSDLQVESKSQQDEEIQCSKQLNFQSHTVTEMPQGCRQQNFQSHTVTEISSDGNETAIDVCSVLQCGSSADSLVEQHKGQSMDDGSVEVDEDLSCYEMKTCNSSVDSMKDAIDETLFLSCISSDNSLKNSTDLSSNETKTDLNSVDNSTHASNSVNTVEITANSSLSNKIETVEILSIESVDSNFNESLTVENELISGLNSEAKNVPADTITEVCSMLSKDNSNNTVTESHDGSISVQNQLYLIDGEIKSDEVATCDVMSANDVCVSSSAGNLCSNSHEENEHCQPEVDADRHENIINKNLMYSNVKDKVDDNCSDAVKRENIDYAKSEVNDGSVDKQSAAESLNVVSDCLSDVSLTGEPLIEKSNQTAVSIINNNCENDEINLQKIDSHDASSLRDTKISETMPVECCLQKDLQYQTMSESDSCTAVQSFPIQQHQRESVLQNISVHETEMKSISTGMVSEFNSISFKNPIQGLADERISTKQAAVVGVAKRKCKSPKKIKCRTTSNTVSDNVSSDEVSLVSDSSLMKTMALNKKTNKLPKSTTVNNDDITQIIVTRPPKKLKGKGKKNNLNNSIQQCNRNDTVCLSSAEAVLSDPAVSMLQMINRNTSAGTTSSICDAGNTTSSLFKSSVDSNQMLNLFDERLGSNDCSVENGSDFNKAAVGVVEKSGSKKKSAQAKVTNVSGKLCTYSQVSVDMPDARSETKMSGLGSGSNIVVTTGKRKYVKKKPSTKMAASECEVKNPVGVSLLQNCDKVNSEDNLSASHNIKTKSKLSKDSIKMLPSMDSTDANNGNDLCKPMFEVTNTGKKMSKNQKQAKPNTDADVIIEKDETSESKVRDILKNAVMEINRNQGEVKTGQDAFSECVKKETAASKSKKKKSKISMTATPEIKVSSKPVIESCESFDVSDCTRQVLDTLARMSGRKCNESTLSSVNDAVIKDDNRQIDGTAESHYVENNGKLDANSSNVADMSSVKISTSIQHLDAGNEYIGGTNPIKPDCQVKYSEGVFECPQCSYKSKKKGQLRKHMMTHKLYSCAHCDFSVHEDSAAFNEHMRVSHPSRSGRRLCKHCHVLFHIDQIDSHEDQCTGEKMGWGCDHCDKKFKFLSALKTHIQRWHSDNSDKITDLNACDAVNKDIVPNSDRKDSENIKTKTIPNLMDLDTRMYEKIQNIEIKPLFPALDDLKNGSDMPDKNNSEIVGGSFEADDKKPIVLKCGYCNKSFKSQNCLNKHESAKHSMAMLLANRTAVMNSERLKSAELNDKVCNVENSAAESPEISDIVKISMSCDTSADQSKNEQLKTGNKYKCSFVTCGKEFTKQLRLLRHEEKHEGLSSDFSEKNYKCDWEKCRKAFLHEQNLLYHREQHINTKPFPCSLCSCGYWQKCSLKAHQLKVHGVCTFSESSEEKTVKEKMNEEMDESTVDNPAEDKLATEEKSATTEEKLATEEILVIEEKAIEEKAIEEKLASEEKSVTDETLLAVTTAEATDVCTNEAKTTKSKKKPNSKKGSKKCKNVIESGETEKVTTKPANVAIIDKVVSSVSNEMLDSSVSTNQNLEVDKPLQKLPAKGRKGAAKSVKKEDVYDSVKAVKSDEKKMGDSAKTSSESVNKGEILLKNARKNKSKKKKNLKNVNNEKNLSGIEGQGNSVSLPVLKDDLEANKPDCDVTECKTLSKNSKSKKPKKNLEPDLEQKTVAAEKPEIKITAAEKRARKSLSESKNSALIPEDSKTTSVSTDVKPEQNASTGKSERGKTPKTIKEGNTANKLSSVKKNQDCIENEIKITDVKKDSKSVERENSAKRHHPGGEGEVPAKRKRGRPPKKSADSVTVEMSASSTTESDNKQIDSDVEKQEIITNSDENKNENKTTLSKNKSLKDPEKVKAIKSDSLKHTHRKEERKPIGIATELVLSEKNNVIIDSDVLNVKPADNVYEFNADDDESFGPLKVRDNSARHESSNSTKILIGTACTASASTLTKPKLEIKGCHVKLSSMSKPDTVIPATHDKKVDSNSKEKEVTKKNLRKGVRGASSAEVDSSECETDLKKTKKSDFEPKGNKWKALQSSSKTYSNFRKNSNQKKAAVSNKKSLKRKTEIEKLLEVFEDKPKYRFPIGARTHVPVVSAEHVDYSLLVNRVCRKIPKEFIPNAKSNSKKSSKEKIVESVEVVKAVESPVKPSAAVEESVTTDTAASSAVQESTKKKTKKGAAKKKQKKGVNKNAEKSVVSDTKISEDTEVTRSEEKLDLIEESTGLSRIARKRKEQLLEPMCDDKIYEEMVLQLPDEINASKEKVVDTSTKAQILLGNDLLQKSITNEEYSTSSAVLKKSEPVPADKQQRHQQTNSSTTSITQTNTSADKSVTEQYDSVSEASEESSPMVTGSEVQDDNRATETCEEQKSNKELVVCGSSSSELNISYSDNSSSVSVTSDSDTRNEETSSKLKFSLAAEDVSPAAHLNDGHDKRDSLSVGQNDYQREISVVDTCNTSVVNMSQQVKSSEDLSTNTPVSIYRPQSLSPKYKEIQSSTLSCSPEEQASDLSMGQKAPGYGDAATPSGFIPGHQYPGHELGGSVNPLQSLEGLASGGAARQLSQINYFDSNEKISYLAALGEPPQKFSRNIDAERSAYGLQSVSSSSYDASVSGASGSTVFNQPGEDKHHFRSPVPPPVPLPHPSSIDAFSKEFFGQYFQDSVVAGGSISNRSYLSSDQRMALSGYGIQQFSGGPHLFPGSSSKQTYPGINESFLKSPMPGGGLPSAVDYHSHIQPVDERSSSTRPWAKPSDSSPGSRYSSRAAERSEAPITAGNSSIPATICTTSVTDVSSSNTKNTAVTDFMSYDTGQMAPSAGLAYATLSYGQGIPGASGYSTHGVSRVNHAPSAADQRQIEDAYRQAAAQFDYRALTHHADMYGAMASGINPGALAGFDRYYYSARDAMYRSHQFGIASSHLMHQGGATPGGGPAAPGGPPTASPMSPIYGVSDGSQTPHGYGREGYGYSPASYGFMSHADRNYLGGGSNHKGVPSSLQGPPGLPGSEYMQNPAMDPSKDPYRRSVLYNMMPRYF